MLLHLRCVYVPTFAYVVSSRDNPFTRKLVRYTYNSTFSCFPCLYIEVYSLPDEFSEGSVGKVKFAIRFEVCFSVFWLLPRSTLVTSWKEIRRAMSSLPDLFPQI
jgi:hypothetical protein